MTIVVSSVCVALDVVREESESISVEAYEYLH